MPIISLLNPATIPSTLPSTSTPNFLKDNPTIEVEEGVTSRSLPLRSLIPPLPQAKLEKVGEEKRREVTHHYVLPQPPLPTHANMLAMKRKLLVSEANMVAMQ